MTILRIKQAYCKLDKDQRLYNLDRPLIGLTGGIATGKSSASMYLKSLGYALIDADQLVKSIYQKSETIDFIKSISPKSIIKNQIQFKELRAEFFNNPQIKVKIENYIYSHLPQEFKIAMRRVIPYGALLYDIPLLFEKNLEVKFDLSICIYSSRKTQLERLVQRDGISEELANKILDTQMSIDEKAKRADILIENTNDRDDLYKNIDQILLKISK